MLNWLKITEFGFDRDSCNTCKSSSDEADELIDGAPFCLKKGYCKHLKNIEGLIKKEGLEGNPMNFYNAGALENFEDLSAKIISLSPYDGLKLPTVSFYSSMEGLSDMGATEFIELLSIKISYIRNKMMADRVKAQNRK